MLGESRNYTACNKATTRWGGVMSNEGLGNVEMTMTTRVGHFGPLTVLVSPKGIFAVANTPQLGEEGGRATLMRVSAYHFHCCGHGKNQGEGRN